MDRSDFYNRTRAAGKIIVVDFGFLGDSVHLIPALWEIKRHYPQAQLHTLSATVGAEVLKLAPCVDRAWAFPLTPQSPPWWRHWNIFGSIRREGFDLAINFNGADRTIFVTRLTGAKWRVAHEGGRRHFWNRWFIPEWVPRQSRELPVFEQRRQILAACGLSLAPARFDLCLPDAAVGWAKAEISNRPIHLSINASTPLKEWPLANWIDLAKRLLQSDPACHLVATASAKPRELERVKDLAAAVNDPRLRCIEAPSIAQLAALLQRCKLHVGADSGVLHLAMAVGAPTFTLFRQYVGLKEWMPPGPRHWNVLAHCDCVEGKPAGCEAAQCARCLQSISAAEVFARIQEQIANRR